MRGSSTQCVKAPVHRPDIDGKKVDFYLRRKVPHHLEERPHCSAGRQRVEEGYSQWRSFRIFHDDG